MLSYQHCYHAGCLADVHKHAALSIILDHMTLKPKPMTYMETHAGRGVYDLNSIESNKTLEAQEGILALKDTAILQETPYHQIIDKIQKLYGKSFYPGSPFIAESILSQTDDLHFMELHPEEYFHLYHSFKAKNTHCHHRDGYEGVLALSPPKARRGLVFIDPSYEIKSEYTKLIDFVAKLHKKWAEATILIWYPVLEANHHIKLSSALYGNKYPKLWSQEWHFKDNSQSMLGSGLIAINIPFGVEDRLKPLIKLDRQSK